MILGSVVYSIILYAAPVWKKAAGHKKYRTMLQRVQRLLMIMISRSYRTVSTEALQVITGSIPIDLLIEERDLLYQGERATRKAHKKEAREKTMKTWQKRWEKTTGKAEWTKKIIPDVAKWINRKHGELTYHLSQMLSGHGVFKTYLKRINRSENGNCWYCPGRDSPEHTLTLCPEWAEIRKENSMVKKTAQELFEEMAQDEDSWKKVTSAIKKIMIEKEKEERRQEDQNTSVSHG